MIYLTLTGWFEFFVASFVLAVTPGPGVIYIVTRTLSQGRRAGVISVIAVAVGNLGNAMIAAVGLAALLATSAAAFTVVKLLGAAYLITLGVAALWGRSGSSREHEMVVMPASRILREGVLASLLNPKTALFFAAFLPQFIEPAGATVSQGVFLG